MLITHAYQISVDWLTTVLRNSSALLEGNVETVQVESGQGNWSTSVSLTIHYSEHAQGSLPQHLFLKMVDTDAGDGEFFDDSEVRYYLQDYVDVPEAPLLRCYDGAYSAADRRYHLLLDDVSATHSIAANQEPGRSYGEALAEGLATLHARWWGADGLHEAGLTLHAADHIQHFVDIAAPGVDHILNRFSSDLKPHWPALLREIYAHHPQALIQRARHANGFTIIHGDVGDANVLVPRQGDRPLYIIDRQPFDWSLTVWLGVYDLAYAMVLDWDSALRQQHEFAVLRAYHQRLLRHGVTDYSWNNLVDDYKLCVPMGVYIATEYCRGGVNERWLDYWLPMLKRVLTACDELACATTWRQ